MYIYIYHRSNGQATDLVILRCRVTYPELPILSAFNCILIYFSIPQQASADTYDMRVTSYLKQNKPEYCVA